MASQHHFGEKPPTTFTGPATGPPQSSGPGAPPPFQQRPRGPYLGFPHGSPSQHPQGSAGASFQNPQMQDRLAPSPSQLMAPLPSQPQSYMHQQRPNGLPMNASANHAPHPVPPVPGHHIPGNFSHSNVQVSSQSQTQASHHVTPPGSATSQSSFQAGSQAQPPPVGPPSFPYPQHHVAPHPFQPMPPNAENKVQAMPIVSHGQPLFGPPGSQTHGGPPASPGLPSYSGAKGPAGLQPGPLSGPPLHPTPPNAPASSGQMFSHGGPPHRPGQFQPHGNLNANSMQHVHQVSQPTGGSGSRPSGFQSQPQGSQSQFPSQSHGDNRQSVIQGSHFLPSPQQPHQVLQPRGAQGGPVQHSSTFHSQSFGGTSQASTPTQSESNDGAHVPQYHSSGQNQPGSQHYQNQFHYPQGGHGSGVPPWHQPRLPPHHSNPTQQIGQRQQGNEIQAQERIASGYHSDGPSLQHSVIPHQSQSFQATEEKSTAQQDSSYDESKLRREQKRKSRWDPLPEEQSTKDTVPPQSEGDSWQSSQSEKTWYPGPGTGHAQELSQKQNGHGGPVPNLDSRSNPGGLIDLAVQAAVLREQENSAQEIISQHRREKRSHETMEMAERDILSIRHDPNDLKEKLLRMTSEHRVDIASKRGRSSQHDQGGGFRFIGHGSPVVCQGCKAAAIHHLSCPSGLVMRTAIFSKVW